MNLHIINAGGGSGKTYRLATEVCQEIAAGKARADGVLLTTFNRKAATELQSRAVKFLTAKGLPNEGQKLRAARIGTVNAVCGKLLSEFSFEAGLPPRQNVLDEDAASFLFRRALAETLKEDVTRRLSRLARRIRGNEATDRIAEIVRAARANAIDADSIRKMGLQSLEDFFAERSAIRAPWVNLLAAVSSSIASIRACEDNTKVTDNALQSLLKFSRVGKDADWGAVNRLSKLAAGKRSGADGFLEPVREIAQRHPDWDEFREDLSAYASMLFQLAADTMESYAELKRKGGFLDFVDQEHLCLQLLEHPQVKARLADELDLMLVDEFQDTSPLQLAVFLKLADIAKRSIWVGDPKQAIYGFRGTDPRLMNACSQALVGEKGRENLPYSWRSLPGLVDFCNSTFEQPFSHQGLKPKQICLSPKRESETGFVLGSWQLVADKETKAPVLLARAVLHHLKATGQSPGEIAVLCRSNEHCSTVAESLIEHGIPADVAVGGLLRATAVRAALAAFRLLLSPRDSLAAAELTHLHRVCCGSISESDWLSQRLEEVDAKERNPWSTDPLLQRLRAAAANCPDKSPLQLMRIAIEEGEVWRLVQVDPNPRTAEACLQRLKQFVCEYVNLRRNLGEGASPEGLVDFLEALRESESDSMPPPSGESVTVSTWHRSKGLEWHTVILYSLNSVPTPDRDFFKLTPVSTKQFDASKPLEGRELRFFPYPYSMPTGGNFGDNAFMQAIRQTESYQQTVRESWAEHLRLLYVIFTRAKDRLVFAWAPKKISGLQWRGGDETHPLFTLPASRAECSESWSYQEFNTATSWTPYNPESGYWFAISGKPPRAEPGDRSPSEWLRYPIDRFRSDTPIPIGSALRLKAVGDRAALGDCLHRYFAARAGGTLHRDGMLSSLAEAYDLQEHIQDKDGEKLWHPLQDWIRTRWPDSRLLAEWPLLYRVDGLCVQGSIDLVVMTAKGFAILDHKSYEGSPDKCRERALEHGNQLSLYAEAMEMASGGACLGTFVHFPLGGCVVQVGFRDGG